MNNTEKSMTESDVQGEKTEAVRASMSHAVARSDVNTLPVSHVLKEIGRLNKSSQEVRNIQSTLRQLIKRELVTEDSLISEFVHNFDSLKSKVKAHVVATKTHHKWPSHLNDIREVIDVLVNANIDNMGFKDALYLLVRRKWGNGISKSKAARLIAENVPVKPYTARAWLLGVNTPSAKSAAVIKNLDEFFDCGGKLIGKIKALSYQDLRWPNGGPRTITPEEQFVMPETIERELADYFGYLVDGRTPKRVKLLIDSLDQRTRVTLNIPGRKSWQRDAEGGCSTADLKDPLIFYAIRSKKRTDRSLVNGSIAA